MPTLELNYGALRDEDGNRRGKIRKKKKKDKDGKERNDKRSREKNKKEEKYREG